LPHGMPRPPACRRHPAVPVALQQGRRGLWAGSKEHRRQPGPPETFLEGCRSGRRLPPRRAVLAQRAPPVALLLAARAPPVGSRGAVGVHRRALGEGLLPAPCSCARHPPVVRLAPSIWPSGPLDLVTRLLHGSCSRLSWRSIGRLDRGEGHARGLDACGREGRQPGRRHRQRDPQAAHRHAGRGAPRQPASPDRPAGAHAP
jgi:hypothetical protein